MATEVKFKTLLAVSELRIKEIEESIVSEDIKDTKNAYEQLDELIKRLEKAKMTPSSILWNRVRNLNS